MSSIMEVPSNEVRKERLLDNRFLFVFIGMTHTLFCAGIVFGWSSLEPIFEAEGVYGGTNEGKYSTVFTYGMMANYLSNLPCGAILDRYGPRATGIFASAGLALGAILCSVATVDSNALIAGFFFLGFFGPCVQLPTLHLACLFPGYSSVVMMIQAAAFDAGSVVFFIARIEYKYDGVSTGAFFGTYLLVPAYVFVIAWYCWPAETMDNDDENDVKADSSETSPLVGTNSSTEVANSEPNQASSWGGDFKPSTKNLHGADIGEIVSTREFWFIAFFAGINIMKLNFIIDSIDDQLDLILPDDSSYLTWNFGWLLPLGFVILPVGSYLLSLKGVHAFHLANVFGVIYGFSLNSSSPEVQLYVTFPLVAMSRQLTYGCVFYAVSEIFGYKNLGVTLGCVNLVVTLLSVAMLPVALACEAANDWVLTNDLLALATIPLILMAPYVLTFSRDKKMKPVYQ